MTYWQAVCAALFLIAVMPKPGGLMKRSERETLTSAVISSLVAISIVALACGYGVQAIVELIERLAAP